MKEEEGGVVKEMLRYHQLCRVTLTCTGSKKSCWEYFKKNRIGHGRHRQSCFRGCWPVR